MNTTLANHILKIKNHLSNKETWEKFHDISEAGFNLGNDLAGLWCCGHKKYYPAAYACVAKAALDFHKDAIYQSETWQKMTFAKSESEYPPDDMDVRTVWSLEKVCTHEQLMRVLDQAIRYANLWIFS